VAEGLVCAVAVDGTCVGAAADACAVVAEELAGAKAVDETGVEAAAETCAVVAEGLAGVVAVDEIRVVAAAETCAVVASGTDVAGDIASPCGEQAEIASAATTIKRTQRRFALISTSRLSKSLSHRDEYMRAVTCMQGAHG
jgi:hypothetical protein